MIFRPSRLERYISTLPTDFQIIALQAVQEEHTRWVEGKLTDSELLFQAQVKNLALSASKNLESMARKIVAQGIDNG